MNQRMTGPSGQTTNQLLPGRRLPQVHSYQKLGDEASRAHGGAVQAEGWGGCQGDRESEPGEGQQSGGPPAGARGLLNLKEGAEVQTQVAQGSPMLPSLAGTTGHPPHHRTSNRDPK